MNRGFITGWTPRGGVKAYTTDGQPRLSFELIVKDSLGGEGTWRAEVRDLALIEKAEELLTPGRAMIAEVELCTRPYEKQGRVVGDVRHLLVHGLEFPDRHKAAASGAAPADERRVA
ncbi:MAG TPA: hypothetical protein VK178_07090 [Opitutaceae bacterium]|nr:hypothetical protein [Opitutaceae bacterium]HLP26736.1 hypothetical protein [Acidobacteriota bacterium]